MALLLGLRAGTMGPSVDSLNDGRWLPGRGRALAIAEFKPQVNIRFGLVSQRQQRLYFQLVKPSDRFVPRPLILTFFWTAAFRFRFLFYQFVSLWDLNCSTTLLFGTLLAVQQ